MRIGYERSLVAWTGFERYLEGLLSDPRIESVCEIGGGANPTLSFDFIERRGIQYTILDLSRRELDKAPAGYDKIVGDITDPKLKIDRTFDFSLTKMLAEHVSDAEGFHRNVFNLLSEGGKAF